MTGMCFDESDLPTGATEEVGGESRQTSFKLLDGAGGSVSFSWEALPDVRAMLDKLEDYYNYRRSR